MITTRREIGESRQTFGACGGNVALFEREMPANTTEIAEEKQATQTEDVNAAREKMQSNLRKLLNYDKPETKEEVKTAAAEAVSSTEQVADSAALQENEEDIRPSSTTRQFGDGDLDQMYSEMGREKDRETYKINGKGKAVLFVYSIVVAIILALIVLNTGVLANIRSRMEVKQAELGILARTYQDKQDYIDSISDNDYVIRLAEGTYGMIKAE